MSAHVLPPAAQMMQFVMGSWVSQAVGAGARLAIADHLAAGAKTAEEVAKRAEASPDAVYRLMRALASLGVFTMSGSEFSLTPLGEMLRSDVPGSMRSIAIAETDRPHWQSWGLFPKAIKEGRKMSTEAVGMEAWEYYAKHPEDGAAVRPRDERALGHGHRAGPGVLRFLRGVQAGRRRRLPRSAARGHPREVPAGERRCCSTCPT